VGEAENKSEYIHEKRAYLYTTRLRSKHEVQLAKYNKNKNIGTLASEYNMVKARDDKYIL